MCFLPKQIPGIDQNDGQVASQVYNCTSFGNGGIGFHFSYQPSLNIKHILKNNISYRDAKEEKSLLDAAVQDHNSWNGVKVKADDFASLTNTGVNGIRQADGSLPNLQFLRLSPNSALVSKGVKITNLLFNGSAPDLGAFEYNSTVAVSM